MAITLKAARINAGLTQVQAATALKVTCLTIANWEKGKSFPDALQIKGIEDLYGFSYNELIFLPQCNG